MWALLYVCHNIRGILLNLDSRREKRYLKSITDLSILAQYQPISINSKAGNITRSTRMIQGRLLG